MTLGLKATPAVTEAIHNTINTEKHKQTYWEITVTAMLLPSTQGFWLTETGINTVILLLYLIILCIIGQAILFQVIFQN